MKDSVQEGVNRQGENPAWLWQHGSDHCLSGDINRAVLLHFQFSSAESEV